MRALTSDDLLAIESLLPFSLEYEDVFTPKEACDMPKDLKPAFLIKPMTVKQRREWSAMAKKIADISRQNYLAMTVAIEKGEGTYSSIPTDSEELSMLAILSDRVTIKSMFEVAGSDAVEFKGSVYDLPVWIQASLSERLQQISTLNKAEKKAFGS